MRLVKILSSAVTDRVTSKKLVSEISNKLKNSLIEKFKKETTDSTDKIGGYIDEFEKYKNGLPVEKRDLSKYPYSDLKSLIESKTFKKKETQLFKSFKKNEEKLENTTLKKTIRKFLEIQDKLGKTKDPSKYKFLDFYKLINQLYPKYINEILFDKFKKENSNLTDDILEFYIGQYIDNFDDIHDRMPSPTTLTFEQFEHYIDGMNKGIESDSFKTSTENIEVVYDKNNLTIFQPKTRDECITLKNGRSWCTSREGGSNLFYNYRLDNKRTLYYVIDQDKDYSDLNFAVVILVDPDGDMSLADGSNSGRYSGHQNIPWNEIVKKIPKLENLKDVFKPKPLTDEELSLIRKIKNTNVGSNPIGSLGDEGMVEFWLEIVSPRLTDEQFLNITPKLRKKYIALGHDLTQGMIVNSDSETKKYYVSKKIDGIRNKNIGQLTDGDIAILNLPGMNRIKEELKTKLAMDFTTGDEVSIKMPGQKEGKYIMLYGFDELIKKLPENIKFLEIKNSEKNENVFSIPMTITRFKELETLVLENVINELPQNIGDLKNLTYLHLINNKNLREVPNSLCDIDSLEIAVFRGNNENIKLPQCFEDGTFGEAGDGFYYKD